MLKCKLACQLALAGSLLLSAAPVGRAQQAATVADLGSTPPTPGPYDQFQLGNDGTTSANPGSLNYYWDDAFNGNYHDLACGQTFTTGANPGGYVLNSVAVKGNSGNYGGDETEQFEVVVYALNGNNGSGELTNAVVLATYLSQSDLLTVGDWYQVTGLNVALAPNTQYAYTFGRAATGSGWQNMSWVGGNAYAGGQVCGIQLAGGAVSYGGVTADSATFDVGLALPTTFAVNPPVASANPVTVGAPVTLSVGTVVDNAGNNTYQYQWQTDGGSGGALTNIPGATATTLAVNTTGKLGGYQYQVVVTDSTLAHVTSVPLVLDVNEILSGSLVDDGTTTPAPGGYDIYQLQGGQLVDPGLNLYTDQGQKGNGGNPPGYAGQTFTTGGNPKGYQFSSLAIDVAGGNASGTTTAQGYDLFIYQLTANGATANLLADVTNLDFAFAYGDWITWSFPAFTLQPNTLYAYAFGRKSSGTGYAGISTAPGGSFAYAGGQICQIAANGGTVLYSTQAGDDATFDIGLLPLGVSLVVNTPAAVPNPAFALSPVTLSGSVQVPSSGTFAYQWLTDDGSGATPPNYLPIPGATSASLTVIPKNFNPGGADYTTNYYFVASLGNSSATSAPVTLTVHAASAPELTGSSTLSNELVTFAGDEYLSYSVAELGTEPLTNGWQLNSGAGFVNLAAQTNTTLTLSNLTTTQSGTYQFAAKNLVGNASLGVALSVLPDPAPPATSEKYAHLVYASNPWAYWRLNETNDPTTAGAPTFSAFDYSGHGFDATYGGFVTVNTLANPQAGPQPPTFPGFSATEAAAQTMAEPNGYLSVPPLHLTGQTNLTFILWINPNTYLPEADTGLLFDRNDADGTYGFGFGGSAGELGYTWNNNSSATYNWASGLYVALNQWNFVAYVVTPTNVTAYLGNLNGGTTNFNYLSNPGANISESFNGTGTTFLGDDSNSTTSRGFQGLIAEAALFTNSLTYAQVENFFLTGLGAETLPPSVGAMTAAPSANVYSGQNVLLSAPVTGSGNLALQWQAGPDGSTWTNVPGATSATVVVNPFAVGTLYYQLTAKNSAGSATNTYIGITFNALPPSPAGQWTVNYQVTNNISGNAYALGTGIGYYTGRGILGNGTYWNIIPDVLTTPFEAQDLVSVTDLRDNGSTASGIYANLYNASGDSSLATPLLYPTDIGNLLDQYVNIYSPVDALQFTGVPNGTYNVVLYGVDGTYDDRGTVFVVHDPVNGNQTNSTANGSSGVPAGTALAQGDNFVLFTNVHVSGGTLSVDIGTNPSEEGSGGGNGVNPEADLNGAQLQLVSYDSTAPVVRLSSTFSSGTATLNLSWPEGVLETSTNLAGPWTTVNVPSPAAFSTTNAAQFYRVKVQ